MVKKLTKGKSKSKKVNKSAEETAEETEHLFRDSISRVETALRIHAVINATIGLGFLYYLRTQESNPSLITRIDRMMYAISGVTALIVIISPLSTLGAVLGLVNTALWMYVIYESYYISGEAKSPTAYHVYLVVSIIIIIKDLGVFIL